MVRAVRGGLLDSGCLLASGPKRLMQRFWDPQISEALSWEGCGRSCSVLACGPVLAWSLVSFGQENVLQILKKEVIARENPDFWLCRTKPNILATPGPYVLVAMSGELSSSCPFLVFGIGLLTPWSNSCSLLYRWGGRGPGRGRDLLQAPWQGRTLGLAWLSSLPSAHPFCPDPLCFCRKSRDAFQKDWGILLPALWG